jgi:hypothetical protein
MANFYLHQGRKTCSSGGGSKRCVGASSSITSNSPILSCGRSAQNCPRCIASQIVIQDRDLCDSRGLPIERNAHAVSLRPRPLVVIHRVVLDGDVRDRSRSARTLWIRAASNEQFNAGMLPNLRLAPVLHHIPRDHNPMRLRFVGNRDTNSRPARVFTGVSRDRQIAASKAYTQTPTNLFCSDDAIASHDDVLRRRRIANPSASTLRARRATNDVVVGNRDVGPKRKVNIVFPAGRLIQDVAREHRTLPGNPSQSDPEPRSVMNDVVGHHHIANSRIRVRSKTNKIAAGTIGAVVNDLDPERRPNGHVPGIAQLVGRGCRACAVVLKIAVRDERIGNELTWVHKQPDGRLIGVNPSRSLYPKLAYTASLHSSRSQRVLARRSITAFISIDRQIRDRYIARCAAKIKHIRRKVNPALSSNNSCKLAAALDPDVIGNGNGRGDQARTRRKHKMLGRFPSRADSSLKLGRIVGRTVAFHPLYDDEATIRTVAAK